MSLLPYQLRVVEDKRLLDMQVNQLKFWLESLASCHTSPEMRELMEFQAEVMSLHSEILARRIQLFVIEDTDQGA